MLNDSGLQRVLVVAAQRTNIASLPAFTSLSGPTPGSSHLLPGHLTATRCGLRRESPAHGNAPDAPQGDQTAAARVVGFHDLIFLGYPYGRVEAPWVLRKDLARCRQVRPRRLVGPSPESELPRIGGQPSDHRSG